MDVSENRGSLGASSKSEGGRYRKESRLLSLGLS